MRSLLLFMRFPLVLLAIPLAACGSSSSGSSGSGSSTGGSGGSGDTEPAAMKGMTAAHNAARAAVVPAASPSIPPLSWSGTVADTAQAWADNCQFMHSGGQYGENIFAGSGSYAPADVVAAWVSEDAGYDYATNSCSDVCGHYTQVVWRDSKDLGCGVTNCTDNSPFGGGAWQMWVCNYDPPGNFNGEKPY
jgi:pathogenesis-related protein 1